MASNLLQYNLVQTATQTIRTFGTVHYVAFGLAGGAGMSYAAQREKYLQVPIAFLFPYLYGGYHLYKNKESVVQWFHKCPVVLRNTPSKE